MHLLFVFTGGTIGSVKSESGISLSAKAPYLLLEKYRERFPLSFTYDVLSPFCELSENFTGKEIGQLLCTVKEHIFRYDGVIVTHGTDTLAYSAAALGYALGNDCPPVCLVCSAYPLAQKEANGIDHLRCALSLIERGKDTGVFVPYRNPGTADTLLHRATRLYASPAYSNDLHSVNGSVYGEMDAHGVFHKNEHFCEMRDRLCAPSSLTLGTRAPILFVHPYPGMRYPDIPSETQAILLDTYHSGTVNAKGEDTRAFLQKAKELCIPLYATGGTRDATYDSTRIFPEFDVTPLVRLSPVAAYMKLWLWGTQATPALLHTPRGGDLF